MDITKTILEFSAKTGVAGAESEVAAFGASLLEPFGEVSRTALGSVVCRVREPGPDGSHLLLDAHIDEIGLIVTYIEESGFLRVAGCGGADRRSLIAAPVVIHARKGAVSGVVCSVPPHLDKGGEKKTPKTEDLYVDIGCSSGEEAEKKVSCGDRITLRAYPSELLGGQMSGKALDDRVGCTAILHALELLGDEPLGIGLSVVFSSMEEVGGQGAQTAAYLIEPTHAVAVDVSFAHTPDSEAVKCGITGKGPMIGFAPILSEAMSREMADTAREEGIPFQNEVMSGKTATNADHIAVSRGGVETALISIPLKYMHTPVETVMIKDVEDTGRLLAAYIRRFAKGAKTR